MGQVKTYLLLLIHCVFKELLVHMFFDFDVKIRIQETKYEGGRDSASSYPFYGLGEVVVRSTLGHVCN